MHAKGVFRGLPRANVIALVASYPSGDSNIVAVRDRLSRKLLGRPFSNSLYSSTCPYVAPFVSHSPMPMWERTPQYIFVGQRCEPGLPSPYICPCYYPHFDFDALRHFLYLRADLEDFLGRLSGMVLVCDCSFDSETCWAFLLQSAFCEVFDTSVVPMELDDFPNDVNSKNKAHNDDLLTTNSA